MKRFSSLRCSSRRAALALAVSVATATIAARASADDAPTPAADPAVAAYCEKVTARAESDASLLLAPTVVGQYIRYPSSGIADATGVHVGSGWQPRVSLSYGLLDAYKGVGILAVGRADCAAETRAAELRSLLEARADIGRPVALQRELDALKAGRPELDALAAKAEERVKREAGTLMDVLEIRRKTSEMDRRVAEVEGELAMLKARHVPAKAMTRVQMMELLRQLDETAATYDDKVAHVRNLDPWRVNVSGGAVSHPAADYFAAIELSYDIGGVVRNGAEARYRNARAEERKVAHSELHAQVEQMLREVDISQREARAELAVVDGQAARVTSLKQALATADAPNAQQLVANLTIESIEINAERNYLAALIEQRSAMENDHGSH